MSIDGEGIPSFFLVEVGSLGEWSLIVLALVLTELLEQVESESDAQAKEEPAVASGCFLWASL